MSTWFILLCLAAGAVAFESGRRLFGKARASLSWPRTSGLVIQSRMQKGPRSGDGGGTEWDEDIRYTYEVEGRGYVGSRVAFGRENVAKAEKKVRDAVGRYAPGVNVEVYYNPQTPEESVLEPGDTRQALVLMAVGAGGIIFGLFTGFIKWTIAS